MLSPAHRSRFLIVAAVISLTAGAWPASNRRSLGGVRAQATSLAGTYRIVFCRAKCSAAGSAGAAVVGVLVLSDSTIDLTRISTPRRTWYLHLFAYVARAPKPNACFVLRPVGTGAEGFAAAAVRVGFTNWVVASADSADIPLYQTADAGYRLGVRLSHGAGNGTGYTWSAYGAHGAPALHEYVALKRVGPADPGKCMAAAERGDNAER